MVKLKKPKKGNLVLVECYSSEGGSVTPVSAVPSAGTSTSGQQNGNPYGSGGQQGSSSGSTSTPSFASILAGKMGKK